MRSDAVNGFKVLCVHKKTGKLIFIHFKPEENTETDVVNAALHSSVHSLCVVCVIVLRTCGVKLFIAFFMISLLKQDICAYTRFLELSVVFNGSSGNIDIYTSYIAVFMVHAVYGLDTFKNIFNRVVDGIFTRFNGEPLVPHILKSDYLGSDLFLRELFSRNVLVFQMIRAIDTAVDAVV